MYQDFYRLKKTPFHITPDPEFLFLSPSHKAALGALVYGIEERQGFVALVGEVGLGKTTILRSYLERVDQSQLKVIYIFNSNVSFSDLLKVICREFGVDDTTDDVFEAVNRLHQVLIDEYKQGRNVALIVDEAQHMPVETLEHLRMLSNLETSTQKLIQIVLVGQPEFEDKLNDHALRQLKQRLVIRATISPLTDEESLAYIGHRLMKVATTDEPIFTKGALRHIIKQARGTPRVLNVLCTNTLIQGFGYRRRRISAAIAKEVIAEYRGKKGRRVVRPWYVLTGGIVLLALLFWFSPYREVLSSSVDLKRVLPQKFSAWLYPDPAPAPALVLPLPPPQAVIQETSAGLPVLPGAGHGAPSVMDTAKESVASPPSDETVTVAPGTLYAVRKGDYITRLAAEIYGVSNPTVLEWIRKHNPQLRNLNRVDVGMQLILPPLPANTR